MALKATAKSPVNIAFIKYWGKKNKTLRIPQNSSVSMNLDNVFTITTVEFSPKFQKDSFKLKNEKTNEKEKQRVVKHLNRIRKKASLNYKAKVVSENNFPKSTGLSSSASGMSALTVAATKALGLNLDKKELSRLSRLGSGSACRSIPDGFVKWQAGINHKTSFAFSLYPPDHFEIYDIVVIASKEKKQIRSTAGHSLAHTSPFLKTRLKNLPKKIKLLEKYLKEKNFTKLGFLSEQEALNMHAVMITSNPSLLYWTPNTLKLMKLVQKWRTKGIEIYFTINTGQDIHFLTRKKELKKLTAKLKKLKIIEKFIINKPAKGARLIKNHLF
jgi:diphosphomevalonate decarboxylase